MRLLHVLQYLSYHCSRLIVLISDKGITPLSKKIVVILIIYQFYYPQNKNNKKHKTLFILGQKQADNK